MDYQKASVIRKKSLLKLIAENKFEQGKGLGSSIGGAISDKFKSKAVGYKESLDPLKWTRKLTGSGTFGDIMTTVAGRAMGRKDSDISYFGGYKRRGIPQLEKLDNTGYDTTQENNSLHDNVQRVGEPLQTSGGSLFFSATKGKSKKKDPQFTTIGSGPVTSLRTDDSVADVLGKMYNFMRKTSEEKQKQHEIESSFRQEQLDEDQKRHDRLIEAITGSKKKNKTATATTPENTDGGIFGTLMNIFKSFMDNPVIKSILEKSKLLIALLEGELLLGLAGGMTGLLGLILNPVVIGGVAAYLAANYFSDLLSKHKIENAKLLGDEKGVEAVKKMETATDTESQQYQQGSQEYRESVLEKQEYVRQFLEKKGYKTYMKRNLAGQDTGYYYYEKPVPGKVFEQKPSEDEMKQANEFADTELKKKQVQTNVATPTSTSTQTTPTPITQNKTESKVNAPTPSATTTSSETNKPEDTVTQIKPVQNTTLTPNTPNVVASPVINSVPDIPPTPESTNSTEVAPPIVQVNNSVKTVGGQKDKVVATSTPKQRNTDLNRYLLANATSY